MDKNNMICFIYHIILALGQVVKQKNTDSDLDNGTTLHKNELSDTYFRINAISINKVS